MLMVVQRVVGPTKAQRHVPIGWSGVYETSGVALMLSPLSSRLHTKVAPSTATAATRSPQKQISLTSFVSPRRSDVTSLSRWIGANQPVRIA